MKVLHVITRFIRGGADENTLLSCNAQAAAGHQVMLIHGRDVSPHLLAQLHPEVRVEAAPNLVREIHPVRDVKALFELKRITHRFAPDIVHTHTSKAGILGRLAAWMDGRRGVVHGVHILPFLNVNPLAGAVYLALEHALAPITAAFVNVSGGMRAACEQARLGLGKHHVVPSGMDVVRFGSARPFSLRELSEELEGRSSEQLVVMAAALEPRKRIWEFLAVFAEVAVACPNAHFVVLGEGHDRNRLETRVRELGLERRVTLLGFRTDPERWMKTAQVCVLSSEREGLPRVLVQYALCGVPIVTTALPGVEDVIQHGVTGVLTPIDNVSAMAEPVISLLCDPEKSKRFREATSALDLSAWSVASMVGRLDDIYDAVLTRGVDAKGLA
ncbi:glycosyltransferase [Caulobacter sp. NIBR2454]|uniref:glycosyltransferase n=1 Tax=Caulobacter sp. NIBR2454 TaxID=3015996 RepID=UPI0022B66C02|nr:glycosyltransferase [Caulobacter sp. NIBR2454]